MDDPVQRLRVLIANERRETLVRVAAIVTALGHEVIAREVTVDEVGAVTARENPDVALVVLGASAEHALSMIGNIVHEATCPVITLLPAEHPDYVRAAARRGIFAYIVDADSEELQSAIDVTLQRFAEYHSLEGAFGRRATIEQAKGMLMARRGIDGDTAFAILRTQSQNTGRKLADVALSLVESNQLTMRSEAASHRR
jgi:response regulator NasT